MIADVTNNIAKVRLITDSNSNIPVRIAGLSAPAIMQGNGDNSTTINLVKHKVSIGDDVYVLKKPAFLPTSIIVGKVTQCQRDQENPLLWSIKLMPASDLQTINNVTVVITDQLKDLQN